MTQEGLTSCEEDLNELDIEYKDLEENHKNYVQKIAEMKKMQNKCLGGIAHQRYRMKQIGETLRRADRKSNDKEEKNAIVELRKKITVQKSFFRDMEEVLPHTNGLYLTIILGSVNVSLLSKADKFKYKEDYEKFKLVLSGITFIASACLLFMPFLHYRYCDAAFHFLMVWYYCTLTIRENILIVNGSRIKGWWVTHHFISTACAGIQLLWPYGVTYMLFRNQFLVFSIYLKGFQSWMWKGLTFVLPFLFTSYAFQLYNAYTLYHLCYHPDYKEWQIPILAVIFLILAMGNIWTTAAVIKQKLHKDGFSIQHKLRNKYRFSSLKSPLKSHNSQKDDKVKDM